MEVPHSLSGGGPLVSEGSARWGRSGRGAPITWSVAGSRRSVAGMRRSVAGWRRSVSGGFFLLLLYVTPGPSTTWAGNILRSKKEMSSR